MFCSILINLAPTPYDLSVAQVTSCLMELNAFWKSMKQLMMCRPLRFAFSAISLRIRIWCVVHLSFLNPACSSDRCGSICAFNLSSTTIINTLPTWLNRAIVPVVATFCQVSFFGIATMTDFAHSSGTLPSCHIWLQIVCISSITFSPPACTFSPLLPLPYIECCAFHLHWAVVRFGLVQLWRSHYYPYQCTDHYDILSTFFCFYFIL